MNLFDLFAKLTLDTSEYDKGLDNSEKKAGGFGDKLKTAMKVGAAALGATTSAVGVFAKQSVEAGATFDSSMSQVAATMGTTVDKIDELRVFAQEMGSTTAFSASQAADALNFMALAGYDAETSMSMLPNVLNLAAAGGIGLAEASDMVTDASSALGLSLDETSELVDKMAAASSKSNTSVAQLGSAILTIGGTAKGMAGGTTELAAALGILADNGIKGAEGGTALRNMILSLTAPTDKAAGAIDALGVEVLDAENNMRPMQDIFADINKSLEGMGEGQKTSVLSDIFNKVDLKSANALLATTSERWDELSAAIDESQGAAEAMANTQLDNLNGDITLFQSALEGAQIALSDQLTPTLRQFVQFGSDGLSRLTEAFNTGGVSGAMDELGSILSEGLSMVIDMLPEMISAGAELLESLAMGIIENLPTIISTGLDVLVSLAQGIAENLPTLIPTIVDVVLQIVDTLTQPDTLAALVDASIAIIIALADGLISALPKLLERAPEIVGNLVTAIVQNAPKLLTSAWELIKKLAKGIVDNLPEILSKGKEIVNKLVDGVKSLFSSIVSIGRDIINSVRDGIKQKIDDAKSWGRDLIQNFLDGIKQKWENLKQTVSNVAQTVKNFLGFSEPKEGPLSDFHTYAPDMMMLFAQGIEQNAGLLRSTLTKALDFSTVSPEFPELQYSGRAVFGGYGAAYGVSEIVLLLQLILERIPSDVRLDSGELVGWLDNALGIRAAQKARGN